MSRTEWLAERAKHEPSEQNKEMARAALEWIKSLTEEELNSSEYLTNLNTVARSGRVDGRSIGLAASLIPAYKRAMDKIEQERIAATGYQSQYVGDVAKRMTLKIKVLKVIPIEGNEWGTTYLHKMTDMEGNILSWFASASSATNLREGKNYTVKLTPKKHEEYKGSKQTLVNRVTLVNHLDENWNVIPEEAVSEA